MLPQEVAEAINDVVKKWSEKYKNQNVKRLRKKYGNSGLTDSMRYEIQQDADREVSELLFYFQTHGRYLDMRRLDAAEGGEATVTALIDWMNGKNLLNELIVGWAAKNGYRRVPADIERRIAWSIIITHRNKPRDRYKWYNSRKQAALNELYINISTVRFDAAMAIRNTITSSV